VTIDILFFPAVENRILEEFYLGRIRSYTAIWLTAFRVTLKYI